jgi:hypothetical protein
MSIAQNSEGDSEIAEPDAIELSAAAMQERPKYWPSPALRASAIPVEAQMTIAAASTILIPSVETFIFVLTIRNARSIAFGCARLVPSCARHCSVIGQFAARENSFEHKICKPYSHYPFRV